MGNPSSAITAEQKMLAALARIERKLVDMERRVRVLKLLNLIQVP